MWTTLKSIPMVVGRQELNERIRDAHASSGASEGADASLKPSLNMAIKTRAL
ncbi:MAG: hypothetical protein JRN61_05765 [Nitrososphaerota archaeon]|nr:hypothetical protein [Nitrososphaerota archaeon]